MSDNTQAGDDQRDGSNDADKKKSSALGARCDLKNIDLNTPGFDASMRSILQPRESDSLDVADMVSNFLKESPRTDYATHSPSHNSDNAQSHSDGASLPTMPREVDVKNTHKHHTDVKKHETNEKKVIIMQSTMDVDMDRGSSDYVDHIIDLWSQCSKVERRMIMSALNLVDKDKAQQDMDDISSDALATITHMRRQLATVRQAPVADTHEQPQSETHTDNIARAQEASEVVSEPEATADTDNKTNDVSDDGGLNGEADSGATADDTGYGSDNVLDAVVESKNINDDDEPDMD